MSRSARWTLWSAWVASSVLLCAVTRSQLSASDGASPELVCEKLCKNLQFVYHPDFGSGPFSQYNYYQGGQSNRQGLMAWTTGQADGATPVIVLPREFIERKIMLNGDRGDCYLYGEDGDSYEAFPPMSTVLVTFYPARFECGTGP